MAAPARPARCGRTSCRDSRYPADRQAAALWPGRPSDDPEVPGVIQIRHLRLVVEQLALFLLAEYVLELAAELRADKVAGAECIHRGLPGARPKGRLRIGIAGDWRAGLAGMLQAVQHGRQHGGG